MIEYYTMASFYSSLCGEGDMLPNTYLADQKLANSSKLNKESRQHISQNHALSLSLGSQEPSLLQMHTTNYSSCNTQSDSGVELSQNDHDNNVQYYQEQNYQGRWSLCESTYLKAAQDLLDELVNVHRAPIVKNDEEALLDYDISPASECQDLRNKHTKLFCMLDEVDRRLKQYEHEMQAVVSSLETVAGRGAALSYTFLPLQTISRHFRCLRHAIKKQIQVDSSHAGFGVLSRLRRVDQQLRQQKALQHQQFGFIRQPWRPQRGLPETAVSALRAWLFHHFLHPYPTDSEKMVLARETGLTRSQVANWFINARVRLWKPMIEEIYKEEFGDEREEVSVSAALHSDTDSFKHTIESRGNDASSASMIVDKVEYYYNMGPGNNHNGFSNTHLLADGR